MDKKERKHGNVNNEHKFQHKFLVAIVVVVVGGYLLYILLVMDYLLVSILRHKSRFIRCSKQKSNVSKPHRDAIANDCVCA